MKISRVFSRIAILCLMLLTGISAYAQNSFSLSLKLIDEKTGEPVGFATASLTVKGEKTASKYVLTDSEGSASISKVKKGTYILKAELMGYKPYEQEITVDKTADLGTIKMKEDVEVLDAASVSAVGNPIIVKKDTIEYTASSFKTSDNDMLEDLLKKLPGVEVNSDGSITANGETIKKITIDGKTFFLDDPQLASKNLPAKMIEKVKVVERKSDQARFTGIDDGQEETIIDLSVYKGMMNGWFGNIMAGGGHDAPEKGYYNSEHKFMDEGWRYQGAGIVGNFRENSQISIILNANNTNNRGFNDLAGGMMRGMRGGMGRGGFGGGNGITSSWMGGLNGAWDLFDGNMELSGNYLYNGSDSFVEEESKKITYMQDNSRLVNDNSGTSTTGTYGHRFGVRLDHEFNENTSVLFEPQFNFGGGSFNEYSKFSSYTIAADEAEKKFTNQGYNTSYGSNENWSASGRLLLRQRLGKDGRTISFNASYSFSDNDMLSYNQSLTKALNPEGIMSIDPINQKYVQNSKNSSLSGRLVYTEPLTKHLFMEANYQYSWNRSTSRKDAFNSGNINDPVDDVDVPLIYQDKGETPDDLYSNSIINEYVNQRAGVSLTWQTEKLNAQIGASANPTNTYNKTNGKEYDSFVVNWSPTARVRYRFSDYTNLMLNYNGRSSQPSTSQLMPVPDNTNPLNISLGNPHLKPYFNHNIRASFGYTNMQSFTSVNVNLSGGIVQDAITNAQWYDQAGVQYSIPVNGPGTGNANASLMVNTPLGKSDFSIMSMTNARYSQSTSYLGTGSLDSGKYYDAEKVSFDYDQFHKDFPDLGDTPAFVENRIQTAGITQSLRLTYRNDFVELVAGGRTNMSKSFYTINAVNKNTTWSNNASFEMNWTLPFGMNLISDLNYRWYNGYATPQEPEFIWNAEITQLFFDNKCTLAIRAYDLLSQAKNLFVTDASNYHQETRNNTLGRYVVISFTYRFGTFGGNRGGRRGPGGGGGMRGGPGGGGRMMGPPPGMGGGRPF
ncbi:MAG: outer membrane beta-barrel protein [Bacteroidales bacterium]|nr:outer membrane beta-barrel protein [Bacteroidales bacterium]